MSFPVFEFTPGDRPLLVSMPHVGSHIPPELRCRYTAKALTLADTDWHLPRLYDFARSLGASVLVATYSRYVIDLNRPPNDQNLYPGQNTTGLCPRDDFDEDPVYLAGQQPAQAEIDRRRDAYWKPYHDALQQELARLRAKFGRVVLWDAHSIRSVLPRFFEGKLPDFNLGTHNGASCAPELAQRLFDEFKAVRGHTSVLNGRFTGGYITRQYGRPQDGVHAVQLEMCQSTYMQENLPFAYDEALAAPVQKILRARLESALEFAEGGKPRKG